jgi:hypothetical protein
MRQKTTTYSNDQEAWRRSSHLSPCKSHEAGRSPASKEWVLLSWDCSVFEHRSVTACSRSEIRGCSLLPQVAGASAPRIASAVTLECHPTERTQRLGALLPLVRPDPGSAGFCSGKSSKYSENSPMGLEFNEFTATRNYGITCTLVGELSLAPLSGVDTRSIVSHSRTVPVKPSRCASQ